jgi:ABC-type Fe3+-siderophore transport system permease subunit
MLAGALLMLVVDTLARAAFETEVPPGVLMALIGAPALFGLLALRPSR